MSKKNNLQTKINNIVLFNIIKRFIFRMFLFIVGTIFMTAGIIVTYNFMFQHPSEIFQYKNLFIISDLSFAYLCYERLYLELNKIK